MNSQQILYALSAMNRYVSINCFVLAADEFALLDLNQLVELTVLICNVDPFWLPGGHWVCVFVDQHSEVYDFFDSYGKHFKTYGNHFSALNQCCVNVNNIVMQLLVSNICGQYCLVYAYFKSYELNLNAFVKKLDLRANQAARNDKIIKKTYF